jgi:superfamily II DNA or RNA helicase
MKDWQLKVAEEADIIFATYAIAEEGLDIFGLNTLVLANSIKDPIQSIGRILRKPIEEGDTNPLIIDIGDNLSTFAKWSHERIKYYRQNKYIVNYAKVHNDKCISIYDYLISKGVNVSKNFDLETIRQIYIEYKSGKDMYPFEKKLNFRNYPDAMFDLDLDYKKMFKINYDSSISSQGSVIDYEPITFKD